MESSFPYGYLCENCKIYAMNRIKKSEPLKMSIMSDQPWSSLSLDFHDLPNGNELLLIKDEATKQVIYDEVKSNALRLILRVLCFGSFRQDYIASRCSENFQNG